MLNLVKRLFMLSVTIIAICISCRLDAKAQTITSNNFDAEWYLTQHPELEESCGHDAASVYQFYKTIGKK